MNKNRVALDFPVPPADFTGTETSPTVKRRRDERIDIVKGIAMFLIVSIHTEVFGKIGTPYPVIAVPLFFFLSGFYDNTHQPFRTWFPRSFLSLFVTGVIWVLITFAFTKTLTYIKDGSFTVSATWEDPLVAGKVTWFLFALFYAKLLTAAVHCTHLLKPMLWVSLVAAALVSRYDLPLLLDEGISALPFYLAGKLAYPHIKKWIQHKALVIVSLLSFALMPQAWFPYLLVSYDSDKPVFLYPLAFLVSILSFVFFLWLGTNLRRCTWLANFGKESLGVMLIHPILLHTTAVVLNRLFVPGSTPWIALFLLAYFAVCFLCYHLSVLCKRYCPILLGSTRRGATVVASGSAKLFRRYGA